ncbi:Dual-specificity RNA methyltransferase RlmN [uncultured delta proteobacterium]|uniref:Probable dual-specificity RNA methyltransferase RlmN n=1 Tax=uncultured delta proteobacterium TaxID=34034 RepID=A0A212KHC1_9DELT|nr:Dual-specificity RNA methyltransferase RlmN [uncultured delta proteobacterium]
MIDILNMTHPELVSFIRDELGEPAFRADQVWQWLWQKGASSFSAMTNVSKTTRAVLAERCVIRVPEIVAEEKSADGTVKFLLRLADGECVETVLIPSESREGIPRMTQCISCQVGCAMACTFCATGQMGIIRNMTMGEILGQVLVARRYLGDTVENPRLRNIVFMGMGEPLLNFKEVMRSLEVMNHEMGFNFSPRRITVSTCGLQKGLLELGESGLAYLAVSLHAPTQELRAKIMPKAAHWPLEDLVATLAAYPLKTRERLTFEYLLLGGVNDQPEHARALAKLMGKVKAKLNLIVYNPVPGAPYAAPAQKDVDAFQDILHAKHITAIIRKSKGQDIKAACGQLRAAAQSKREERDE